MCGVRLQYLNFKIDLVHYYALLTLQENTKHVCFTQFSFRVISLPSFHFQPSAFLKLNLNNARLRIKKKRKNSSLAVKNIFNVVMARRSTFIPLRHKNDKYKKRTEPTFFFRVVSCLSISQIYTWCVTFGVATLI